MKEHIRILGIDDSPFSFEDESAEIVGALIRTPNYIEAVMKSEIDVDGWNSTRNLTDMVRSSRYRENISMIFLDGIALGGFNVVDIGKLSEEVEIPVASISRKRPDLESIRIALEKKFDDWKERFELITKNEIKKVETEHKPVYVQHVGVGFAELKSMIRKSTVRGALPEPIRVAHLIVTAFKRGESYGRA
ncbi:MAG: DUF99 family protein [Thermoplasmata archaeon]|nr:DUF99 family protein [Thermoplasmata archaeon]MCK4454748.1 DUF99 family protein [Thermoplasmata archaeon]